MIRTNYTPKRSHHRNPESSGIGNILYTCYTLSRIIPDLECLRDYYDSHTSYDDHIGTGIDMEEHDEIIQIIEEWLRDTDKIIVFVGLSNVRRQNMDAFQNARQLVDPKYQHHFNHILSLKSVSSIMVRPAVVFFPGSKRAGAFIRKTIKRPPIGNTTIINKEVLPFGTDFKTLFRLMELMFQKEVCVYGDKFVSFRTSYTEICKRLVSDPTDKSSHRAVHNSLVRLAGCVIIWKNKEGRRRWGGILSNVEEMNKEGEINICINMSYIYSYKKGYLDIDPVVLYKLTKDIDIMVYVSVFGQKAFTEYRLYHTNFSNFSKLTNLDKVLGEEGKKEETIRYQITQSVNRIKKEKGFRCLISGDGLEFRRRRKQLAENKLENVLIR